MFLYSMLDSTRNYGRMDDYLGRLYIADIDSDRMDDEEATRHPDKYANLIVRVGGFSERFVNLPPDTQQEILSRTLY